MLRRGNTTLDGVADAKSYGQIDALRKEITSQDSKEMIAARAKVVVKALLEDLWFFSRTFVLVLLVATYENILGQRTLAPVARVATGLAIALFLCTVTIPGYAFWRYDVVGTYIRANTVAETSEVPTALDILWEKDNRRKIVQTIVSTVVLVLTNFLFVG
jgi:hypothetical protein